MQSMHIIIFSCIRIGRIHAKICKFGLFAAGLGLWLKYGLSEALTEDD